MSHTHVAVVIDHKEARVLHADEHEVVHVQAHHHAPRHKEQHQHLPDAAYYADVAKALLDAEAILLMGAGTAKQELMNHLQAHAPGIAAKVVEVVTIDRPTDRQLGALVREHFAKIDRMRGIHVSS
ncbi:MAG: hypothetical protein JNL79_25780 [Myxococcales bacterium]|nr:hypothetical protein [Myxococcales bacterium]